MFWSILAGKKPEEKVESFVCHLEYLVEFYLQGEEVNHKTPLNKTTYRVIKRGSFCKVIFATGSLTIKQVGTFLKWHIE